MANKRDKRSPSPTPPQSSLQEGLDTEPAEDAQSASKTSRKKDAERLQQQGKVLATLTAEQLAQINMSDSLRHAVREYQRFKSREAKRRQLQYVGRLMRSEDYAAIEQQLHTLAGQSASAQYQFHQLEKWRDALLTDNQAITQFIDTYPGVDRQRLRQLVKAARAATSQTTGAEKNAARTLFRFIRETSEASH